MIDFAHTSKAIIELFDDTYNLDFFFLQLQQLTGVRLYENESVIIFDKVQLLPKARLAIKYLVADGRRFHKDRQNRPCRRYKLFISGGDKISPIEVKTGNYREHSSLDVFCGKYSSRIRDKYVVHTKDYKWEKGIHYLPVYMVPFL